MPFLAAPPKIPLRVAVADHDGHGRLRARLRLWAIAFMTIAVTAWLCTFGFIAAVLALAVAKHVLVAILVMGLGVDSTRKVAVKDG